MSKIVSKRHLRRKITFNTKQKIHNLNNIIQHTLPSISLQNEENVRDDQVLPQPVQSSHTNYNLEIITANDQDLPKPQIENLKSNEEISDEIEFTHKFRLWILSNPSISHSCVNELIKLIKPRYPFLKNDARSILGTPRNVNTIKLLNGEMVYFGIKNCLEKRIAAENCSDWQTVSVQINIDGLPIYNSSNIEFWPILLRCPCFKNNSYPIVVAIFCGVGKPDPLGAYLKPFIDELLVLLQEGLANRKIKLELFCCDAPARAYLKEITGHSSTYSCERCNIKTEFSLPERKRFFPVNIVGDPRVDTDFHDDITNNKHIKNKSPLLKLDGLGLVSNFVLDPMHLIYLGVVKRLIVNYWLEGKRPFKISKNVIENINSLLHNLRKYIPSEFGRKIRTLKDVKRWKAVEFRFFLLYCGMVVLANTVNTVIYKHFLLLQTAIFILNSQELIEKYLNFAQRCLKKFVNKSPEIYDKFFVTYNVHSLLHICDDVKSYGPLEDYSSFGFESYLGCIKGKIRGRNLPLQQIHNRLVEFSNIHNNITKCTDEMPKMIPIHVQRKNEAGDYFQCKKLKTTKFTISVARPDNIVGVGSKIFSIKSIFCMNNIYKCIGVPFRYLDDFYKFPIESSKLGIYFAMGSGKPDIFLLTDIKIKYFSVPYKTGIVVVPIVHMICSQ